MNHVEKSKELGLSPDQYVLVGGSVLNIHGIRKSNDIDVIVSPEAFEELKQRDGWELDKVFEKRWGREYLKYGVFEVLTDLAFERYDYLFPFIMLRDMSPMIEGVHVQPLGLTLLGKKDIGREKDLKDIDLIEEYFKVK